MRSQVRLYYGAKHQGRTLPVTTRRDMEYSFGVDLSDVRIYTGPQAGALGADAFTHGSDIYFAPGCFDPNSVQGLRLLGHELAHVVQQRVGSTPTPQNTPPGLYLLHEQALEREADLLADRAL